MARPTKQETLRKKFLPLVAKLVRLLVLEPPSTDNKRQRAKINIEMKIGEPMFKGFLRHVSIPCDKEGYEIKQWRCFTLLDWMYSQGYSDWNSSDIIKRRSNVLVRMNKLEEDIDNCFMKM